MTKLLSSLAIGTFALLAMDRAAADIGYLPKLGSIPLRFQAPPNLALPKFELPPLATSLEPSAPDFTETNVVTKTAVTRTNQPAVSHPAPPAAAPNQPPAPATNVEPNNASSPQGIDTPFGQNDLLAPQMLLRYFRRSTNDASSVIVSPGFTPPPVTAPPSSTATYSTSPP